MNPEEQKQLTYSLQFANEFLKLSRKVQKEVKREDQLPEEIVGHLAGQELESIMSDLKLEPEMLLWGLLNIIEILVRYSELEPEDLTEMIDMFITRKKNELMIEVIDCPTETCTKHEINRTTGEDTHRGERL